MTRFWDTLTSYQCTVSLPPPAIYRVIAMEVMLILGLRRKRLTSTLGELVISGWSGKGRKDNLEPHAELAMQRKLDGKAGRPAQNVHTWERNAGSASSYVHYRSAISAMDDSDPQGNESDAMTPIITNLSLPRTGPNERVTPILQLPPNNHWTRVKWPRAKLLFKKWTKITSKTPKNLGSWKLRP